MQKQSSCIKGCGYNVLILLKNDYMHDVMSCQHVMHTQSKYKHMCMNEKVCVRMQAHTHTTTHTHARTQACMHARTHTHTQTTHTHSHTHTHTHAHTHIHTHTHLISSICFLSIPGSVQELVLFM